MCVESARINIVAFDLHVIHVFLGGRGRVNKAEETHTESLLSGVLRLVHVSLFFNASMLLLVRRHKALRVAHARV